jgi:uncharacterized protein (DUF362 family)
MADSRRGFLTKLLLGLGGLGIGLSGAGRSLLATLGVSAGTAGVARAQEPALPRGESVWAEGADPYATTVAAVKELGGIKRFVKPGQNVLILPNIGWARTMEQGACTHPEVVRALIDLCDQAEAKTINLFCNPCNDIRVCLDKSGIGAVIDASRARFEFINKKGWRKREAVPGCKHLTATNVYRLVDDCDVMINAPVAKHHGSSRLTMCCKNLMGAILDRRTVHQKLNTSIADLTMMIPHQLCVLDASRILLRHGPTGGNLDDVAWKNTIIAGTHPVEVDALGTTLFGMQPAEIDHLKILHERGVGQIDPAKLTVKRIKV